MNNNHFKSFVCKKCGLCCSSFDDGKNYFTIFSWEKTYLESQAKLLNIVLNIKPSSGYIFNDKILIQTYDIYMPKICPFYNNGCIINNHKPIMCAIYPYTDWFYYHENWRCLREKKEKIYKKRTELIDKNYVLKHKSSISISYLIEYILKWKIDMLFNRNNYNISQFNTNINKIKGVFNYKDYYGELIRLNLIKEDIINIIKNINFNDIDVSLKLLENIINDKKSYYPLDDESLKLIFDHWNETEAKIIVV